MRFTVDRLDHMVLSCRDMEVSASWYQRVLGMEREEFGPRNRTALRFGGQKINLDPVTLEARPNTAAAPVTGSQNLCFVTAIRPADVVEHLAKCGVTIVEGPAAKVGALGPITSVYCRDPDGNLIEIATYLRD
ncbi:MAG: VOC family protein [Acetobacteraceae bacterium]|nr:VOC family protein [Acetobacteraceae bacterium]